MRTAVIEAGDGRERLAITVVGDGRFDDRWIVRLETPDVTAAHEFWSGAEPARLIEWFESLASDWRGWEGERYWTTVEHDLRLSASHDGRGHVLLWVTLGPVVAPPANSWLVTMPVTFEAGQLDRLAADLRPLA